MMRRFGELLSEIGDAVVEVSPDHEWEPLWPMEANVQVDPPTGARCVDCGTWTEDLDDIVFVEVP